MLCWCEMMEAFAVHLQCKEWMLMKMTVYISGSRGCFRCNIMEKSGSQWALVERLDFDWRHPPTKWETKRLPSFETEFIYNLLPVVISLRATKRGGCLKRGCFLIWTRPSFFALFRAFPIFPGFFRFFRLMSLIASTYEEQS